MTIGIIICAAVLLICAGSSKILYRFGVPTLLIFILLGMLFGSDGIVGIPFDNYSLAQQISSVALIFIMFYGGFGTNWKAARPVAAPSILMATLGVVVTSAITGLFCHYILRFAWLESFLIGSVIGSTDAASVFSIFRSKKLNLKGGLASLLEIESGSNDPISYMLTITVLTFLSAGNEAGVFALLFRQILFGLSVGFVIAVLAAFILKRVNFEIQGLNAITVVAIALLTFALSDLLGGNGYLSVYIVGIVLGNSKILHKRSLVHFFDGITWLMQITLFFMLGLLAFPSRLSSIALEASLIAIFLMLVARPAATFAILSWFKIPVKQLILISFAGLRGAASIVFAIFAINSGVYTNFDLFHIVFLVALFSVSIQGTLLPRLAAKLGLVDNFNPVLKTFTDYREENGTKLLEYAIKATDSWAGKTIMEADIPDEVLVVMVKRGEEVIVPKGSTTIQPGDILVLNAANFSSLMNHETTVKRP